MPIYMIIHQILKITGIIMCVLELYNGNSDKALLWSTVAIANDAQTKIRSRAR